jgi:manganese-dependent inorganic pyrophosphatase
MIYVFGHTVPDTDAITSAIVYAHFLSETGNKATPLALWESNKETLYVLNQAWVIIPDRNDELPEWSIIALVDHNESAQSISNRSIYIIHSVIDHHKIGDLETWYPLLLRFEALASTNSVLYKMYKEAGVTIDKKIATLMLGGILSDTLHFRSPTTTDFDRSLVPVLAQIADIEDVEWFAMQMFAAKSDLGDISAYTLIKDIDAKDFTFAGRRSLIACIETTNPNYCMARKSEIIDTIRTIKSEEWYDFILFCVIDILNEQNITLVASDKEAEIIKKTFGADTVDGQANLGNRISRKKTIVPFLEEILV